METGWLGRCRGFRVQFFTLKGTKSIPKSRSCPPNGFRKKFNFFKTGIAEFSLVCILACFSIEALCKMRAHAMASEPHNLLHKHVPKKGKTIVAVLWSREPQKRVSAKNKNKKLRERSMFCLLLLATRFVPLVTGSIDNPDVFVSATFVWAHPAEKTAARSQNNGIRRIPTHWDKHLILGREN